MITEKYNIKEILKFLFKERKSFLLIVFLLLFLLVVSIFFYNDLIVSERVFFENRIIENFNSKIDSTVSFIVNSIQNLNQQSNTSLFSFYSDLLGKVDSNSYINFAIIYPDFKNFVKLSEYEINEEKKEEAYLAYVSALQAYQNKQFQLAESYLLENIQTKSSFIYTSLLSFDLLFDIYKELGNLPQLEIYSNKALYHILLHKINTPLIYKLMQNFYIYNNSKKTRDTIIFQKRIFDLFKLDNPENILSTAYALPFSKNVVDYLSSPSFEKEFYNFLHSIDKQKIYFFNLLDDKDAIFIGFVNLNSKNFPIIYSIDLTKLASLLSDSKNIYLFDFSMQYDSLPSQKESYSLYKTTDITIGSYRKLYAGMYVRSEEFYGYISKKRYKISNIAFLALLLIIFITITLLITFTLKEFTLNKLKSDFISIVSHELKTPITAMQLMLETIIVRYDKIDDNKKIDYMQKIFKETERLLFLINNLLAYSRSEKGKNTISYSEINIVEVLTEVLEFFKIDKKNLQFNIDIPKNEIIIDADGQSLKQVFYNLIDNSYKYSGDNKIINISINIDKNIIKIIFKDNGYGINPKDLPYIFEKFYRGSETNLVPGTGLGLSLTKSIIEMHQGKITVNSTLGEGTTFTIILPIKKKKVKGRPNEPKEDLIG
jgi:signal transduction histidine kinase